MIVPRAAAGAQIPPPAPVSHGSMAAPHCGSQAVAIVSIQLDAPARAVTPGQAAVVYDGEHVLGGGWIV